MPVIVRVFIITMNRSCICTILFIAFTTVLFWIYWSSITRLKHNPVISLAQEDAPYFDENLIQNNLITPILPKCTEAEASPFLLIIVTSYVGHVGLRSAHRRAMPLEYLDTFNATRIFLLAKIPQNETNLTQSDIDNESSINGDILQGSFIENYRNLSYKHLMGLQWVVNHCNKSKYIIKVDDDIVFNLEETYHLINNAMNVTTENYILGSIFNYSYPQRDKTEKWYVTMEEYPLSLYPVYVSGWFYITTPQVADRLCKVAKNHLFFWIDDIFVTGILTETLKIVPRQVPYTFWTDHDELVQCCIRDMIQKQYKCTYGVGPNNNNDNFILEFYDALRQCERLKNCTHRPDDLPLEDNCMVYSDYGQNFTFLDFLNHKINATL